MAQSDSKPVKALSAKEIEALSQELLFYGIELEDGLRYLGGDPVQFVKLSAFFSENYEATKAEILQKATAGDYTNLKFSVHSLKSKAKAVGANYLSATALQLSVHI